MAAKERPHAERAIAILGRACIWARLLVAAIATLAIPTAAHALTLAAPLAAENSPLGLGRNPAPDRALAELPQASETLLESAFAYGQTAVDNAYATRGGETAARFIVSPRGTAVEKAIADRWAKGTFGNVVDSLEYHFGKHGAGRTLQQYTDDAAKFFQQNKGQAQWGKWNPNWEPAYRLKVGGQGGYFTGDGKILTFWD